MTVIVTMNIHEHGDDYSDDAGANTTDNGNDKEK
jgi:hypothetical protein